MKTKSLLIKILVKTESINLKNIFSENGKMYTFLNPVSYLEARKHQELFSSMDGLFSDGSILALFIKVFYFKNISRRSFDMTSLAAEIFKYSVEHNKTIYFIGSKQEQVEKAVQIFQDSYPTLRIVGYRNGYLKSEEEQMAEARHICDLNPDFLVVGLGIIRQERFLHLVKETGYKGIGFTCGGFLHQTAKNKVNYYPKWVDRYNLRFLYRMIVEKHTRKRYLKAALVFPIKFIRDRFS